MRIRTIITVVAIAIGLVASLPVAPSAGADPVDQLRLRCRLGSFEEQRAVVCAWSHIDDRAVAGYRLLRSVDGSARAVIFRTPADGRQRFPDTDIAAGHRYRYAVVAVDAAGTVLAVSPVAHVGIPPG